MIVALPALCIGAEHPIVAARETISEGDRLYREGSIEAACLRYELAFATAPEWWYAAYKNAQCSTLDGPTPEGLYLLTRASHGDEVVAPVRVGLARFYRDNGEFELAEHHYLAALQLSRGAIEPMVELADLYETQGDLKSAMKWLNRAHYFTHSNLTVRSRLARVCEGMGRLHDTEVHLRYLAVYGVNPRRNLARLARFYLRQKETSAGNRVLRLLSQGRTMPSMRSLPKAKFPPPGTP